LQDNELRRLRAPFVWRLSDLFSHRDPGRSNKTRLSLVEPNRPRTAGSRRRVLLTDHRSESSKAQTGCQIPKRSLARGREARGIVRPPSRAHRRLEDGSSANRESAYGQCPTQTPTTDLFHFRRDRAPRHCSVCRPVSEYPLATVSATATAIG